MRPGTARTWPAPGGTEDLRPERIRTPGLEPQSTSSNCGEEVWGGLGWLEPEKSCGQGGDRETKRAPPCLAAFHSGGAIP